MKISHTDILVKIDENTELIEAPIMSYDKNSYKAPIYKTNEFNHNVAEIPIIFSGWVVH